MKVKGRIFEGDLKEYGSKYNLPESEAVFVQTGFWQNGSRKQASYELESRYATADVIIQFSRNKNNIFFIETID